MGTSLSKQLRNWVLIVADVTPRMSGIRAPLSSATRASARVSPKAARMAETLVRDCAVESTNTISTLAGAVSSQNARDGRGSRTGMTSKAPCRSGG